MERHENKRKIALEISPSSVSISLLSLPPLSSSNPYVSPRSLHRCRADASSGRRMVKLNLRLKSKTFRRSSEFGCAGEDELVDKRVSGPSECQERSGDEPGCR